MYNAWECTKSPAGAGLRASAALPADILLMGVHARYGVTLWRGAGLDYGSLVARLRFSAIRA